MSVTSADVEKSQYIGIGNFGKNLHYYIINESLTGCFTMIHGYAKTIKNKILFKKLVGGF